jgi:hypothetical protein
MHDIAMTARGQGAGNNAGRSGRAARHTAGPGRQAASAMRRIRTGRAAPGIGAVLALLMQPALQAAQWELLQPWPIDGTGEAAQSRVAGDGQDGTLLALGGEGSTVLEVTRVDGAGARLWQRRASGVGPGPTAIAACGERVCVATGDLVAQLRLSDGAPLWQQVHAVTAIDRRIYPGPDGGMDLVDLYAYFGDPAAGIGGQVLQRWSADGLAGWRDSFGLQGFPGFARWLTAGDGAGQWAYLNGIFNRNTMTWMDGPGPAVGFAMLLPGLFSQPQLVQPGLIRAGSDAVYLGLGEPPAFGGAPRPAVLVQVRPDQAPRITPVGAWPIASGNDVRAWIADHGEGDTLLALSTIAADPGQGLERFQVMRVRGDGSVAWIRRWTSGVERGFDVAAGPEQTVVVASERRDGDRLVRAIDRDGVLVGQRSLVCANGPCPIDAHLAVSAQGRVAGAGRDDSLGRPALRVWSRTGLLAPEPALILADAALDGAWYAPYTAGQGFTARWFAEGNGAGTVFMPWFTVAVGADDPDPPRWYALQGEVAPGAREAVLAIAERRGGVFATAPAAAPVIVGSARLRLTSCATGRLEYRFDAGEIADLEGVVDLARLLPLGAACTAADGQVQPAQAAFDSALTGHWFDPATSGQGLELTRIAPGPGDAGLLYGAWFTFDPAPPPADPVGDRHWFTLQGQAPIAGDGVRAVVLQTLGGRFDYAPAEGAVAVGSADLFPGPGCDRLTLRYRFADSADAGRYRNLGGELQLRRLGACPTP